MKPPREPSPKEKSLFEDRLRLDGEISKKLDEISVLKSELRGIDTELEDIITKKDDIVNFVTHQAQWFPPTEPSFSATTKESYQDLLLGRTYLTKEPCLNLNIFELVKLNPILRWEELGIKREDIFEYKKAVPGYFKVTRTRNSSDFPTDQNTEIKETSKQLSCA